MKILFFILMFFPCLTFSLDCVQEKCTGKVSKIEQFLADNRNSNDLEQQGIIMTPQGISPVKEDNLKSSKLKDTNVINNTPSEKEQEKVVNRTEKVEISNNKNLEEKKILENPIFMLLWLAIFIFLYYYLKEKKKRRKG